jgi:hypothetical protein
MLAQRWVGPSEEEGREEIFAQLFAIGEKLDLGAKEIVVTTLACSTRLVGLRTSAKFGTASGPPLACTRTPSSAPGVSSSDPGGNSFSFRM